MGCSSRAVQVLTAIVFKGVLLLRLQWRKEVDDALYNFGSTAAVELAKSAILPL